MKVYFVRHGESEANLLHEFSNRGFKHGLTKRGIRQAEQLVQNLRGIRLSQVFTSPLKRAFQTAKILARELKTSLEISDALREFDCGILEGKSDPESWDTYDRVFQQWLEGQWNVRIPEGESHRDIQARFIPFIERLSQDYGDENILLMGHGGLYRCMLPLVLVNIDFPTIGDLTIHHTMPIIAETHPGGLFCTYWGAISLYNQASTQ